MKIIIFTMFIFCAFFSCHQGSSNSQNATEATELPPKTKPDKSAKEKIDSYAQTIGLVKNAVAKEKTFAAEGINYKIKTLYVDDILVKLSATYTKDKVQKEEIFYVRNDFPIMYDLNETKTSQKTDEMSEIAATKVYLENNAILEVLSKSKTTKPGGTLSLMDEYFTPISVNTDSLNTILNQQLSFFKDKL